MLLATLTPFAIIVAAVVAGGIQLWESIGHEHRIRWWVLNFFLPGGLMLLYQFIVIRSDPILAAWNAQNLTVTPPVWDIVVSFSPALLLAAVMITLLIRQKKLKDYKLLAVWLIGGIVLAYVPFQLQRRFLFGYFVPAACLAAIAINRVLVTPKRYLRIGVGVLLGLSFLTNLLVISGGVLAAEQRSQDLYYSKNLQVAFDWMLENKKSCDVVLAAPETGVILPGATGWRVVYGHPYETPVAEDLKAKVEQIFTGTMDAAEILAYMEPLGVDFVLIGSDEKSSGADFGWVDNFPKMYSNNEVSLYQVRDCP
ncbi:hypothetical protein EG834_13960 [bacterium]|nr:hypothetical protein [bacterium]